VLPAAIAAVVVVIVGLVIGLVLANNNDKNDKTASPGNSMSPNAASSSSAAPSSATSSAPATAPSSGAPSASVAGSDAVVQGLKNEFARIRGAAPAGEPKSTRANKSTYSTSYEWGWDVPKGDGDLQKAETALAQKLAGYGYTQDDSSNADGPSCRVTSTSSYCSYYLKGSNGYTAELFMTSFSGSLDDGTVTFHLTLQQKNGSDS
jgi:hypothetical protein